MNIDPGKKFDRPEMAGLITGAGLVGLVQVTGIFAPEGLSFYDFVISLYFIAGLLSGYLGPKISWRWGIWLAVPWVVWIFSNIARAGFKDGIAGSLGWLIFYSFPILPASAGAFAGAKAAWLKAKLTGRIKSD